MSRIPEHVQALELYDYLAGITPNVNGVSSIDATITPIFSISQINGALLKQEVQPSDLEEAIRLQLLSGYLREYISYGYSVTHKGLALYHGMKTEPQDDIEPSMLPNIQIKTLYEALNMQTPIEEAWAQLGQTGRVGTKSIDTTTMKFREEQIKAALGKQIADPDLIPKYIDSLLSEKYLAFDKQENTFSVTHRGLAHYHGMMQYQK